MRQRPGAEAVEAAARVVFERAWREDDAIFTPGRAIWTVAHVDELSEHFVRHPDATGDDFMSKFRQQLEAVSDGGRQLAAELLYLNLLPLADYWGSKKREIINTVLSWCSSPVAIPADLDAALEQGVFNGGVAFKTRRWNQLALLIELTRQFKERPLDERSSLLSDPWAFRDFIRGADGPREPAQRNAVLYLAFPGVFPPIVNSDHRKRVVTAFREYLTAPSGDLDRDLYAVQQEVDRQNGGPTDFYVSPWRERWLDPKEPVEPEPPAPADGRRAWLVRGSSVQGVNLVPTWLRDGYVSLAASQLPAVQAGIAREDLKSLVDENYAHVSYSQREQKLDEFHAFLSRMQPGDLVATTTQGRLHVGRLTGEASYVASPDGRSNLRRPVSWRTADGGVDYADLPAALAARLQFQHDVIELTQQLPDLESLIPGGGTERPPSRPLVLPDATDHLADELLVSRSWLQECIELLRDRPQLVFYGPPGTGKTYLAQHLAWHLAGRENTTLVQFHPAYSYEDFFEGYRPKAAHGGTLAFELQSGPFRRIVDQARERPETPYVLIVDEINRGNLAKIFGELYFLLEYRDQAIDLLYSSPGEQAFTLPANVFVIGTMNTADRSIALVDAAMRRRFSFVALRPEEEPTRSMLARWLTRHGLPDTTARLLERLNALIDDADFRIGPSYFMRPAVHRDGGLERVWRTAIEPLLEEHHYGEGVDVAERYGLEKLLAPLQRSGVVDGGETPAPDPGADQQG